MVRWGLGDVRWDCIFEKGQERAGGAACSKPPHILQCTGQSPACLGGRSCSCRHRGATGKINKRRGVSTMYAAGRWRPCDTLTSKIPTTSHLADNGRLVASILPQRLAGSRRKGGTHVMGARDGHERATGRRQAAPLVGTRAFTRLFQAATHLGQRGLVCVHARGGRGPKDAGVDPRAHLVAARENGSPDSSMRLCAAGERVRRARNSSANRSARMREPTARASTRGWRCKSPGSACPGPPFGRDWASCRITGSKGERERKGERGAG